VSPMFALPPLRRLVVLSLIALSAALVAPTGAAATGTSIYPPDSQPLGKSYGEWSALWWQQAYATVDIPGAPFANGDVDCAQLGTDDVIFLVGTTPDTGATASRTCDVPAEHAVLIPLINAECSAQFDMQPTYADQLACARGLMDAVDLSTLHLQVARQGKHTVVFPPEVLSGFRFDSPPFTWTSVPGNPFGVDVFTDNPAAASGFYVMLRPLPPGTYDVSFGGTIPDVFSTEANYTLRVR
jgi:hypothetical protein